MTNEDRLSRAFDDRQTQLKSCVKKPRKKGVGFASDSERDWADLFRRGRLRARAQRTDQPESTPQPVTLQVVIFLKEGIGGPKMKSERFGARAPVKHTRPQLENKFPSTKIEIRRSRPDVGSKKP